MNSEQLRDASLLELFALEAESQAEILNHRNDASDSALALAFKRFDDKLAELLLSQDATDVNRPDAQGNTALHLAIHHLSDLCLRIIERPGTELDVPNHQQETPLAIALRRKSQAVVKALLQSGRINLDREDSAGRTPLWQALALAEKAAQSKFWISHESSLNILKALAQAPGFQPDRPRPDGQTPEMFLRSLPDEEFSGKVMQILTEAADSRSGQAAERPAGLPGRPTPAADA